MASLHDDRCATLKNFPCNCASAALDRSVTRQQAENQIKTWYGEAGLDAMELCCLTDEDYALGIVWIDSRVSNAIQDMACP